MKAIALAMARPGSRIDLVVPRSSGRAGVPAIKIAEGKARRTLRAAVRDLYCARCREADYTKMFCREGASELDHREVVRSVMHPDPLPIPSLA